MDKRTDVSRPTGPLGGYLRDLQGLSFAILASTAFALWTVLTKLAFRFGATVPILVLSRFVIGALAILALCRAFRLSLRAGRRLTLRLMALGLSFVLFTVFVNLAILRIPAATTTLLLYTYPAIVTALDVAFGREGWGRLKGLALVLSLGGTGLVLGTPQGALDVAGVLFALGAAFVLAVNMILIDEAARGVHPFVSTAYMMIGGALVVSAYAAVPGRVDINLSGRAWGMVLLLGILSTAVAFTAKVSSIERLGATGASIAATSEPVASVILAAIILSERLGPGQLVGGAMVVAAVGIIPLIRSAEARRTGSALRPERAFLVAPADGGALSPGTGRTFTRAPESGATDR